MNWLRTKLQNWLVTHYLQHHYLGLDLESRIKVAVSREIEKQLAGFTDTAKAKVLAAVEQYLKTNKVIE